MTNGPIIAGLTGSYAAGKSLVSEEFKKLGAHIIDADVLAREVVAPGTAALKEIQQTFGKDMLSEDGSLNRKKMAELIFSDEKCRLKLEAIIHPKVRELFLKKFSEVKKNTKANDLIIYVVPLLFESKNKYPELQKIIVVSAPKEESIDRIIRRDGSTRELAEKKYLSQMPIAQKEKLADFVIRNDSTLEALQASVKRVFSELRK